MSRLTPQPPVALELAAFTLVPAAAWGYVRIFADTGAVLPIIAAAVTSAGLAVLLRRGGLPLAPSGLLSFLALAVLVVRRFAPGTARLGVLPTGETVDALRQLAADGIGQFSEVRAPVEASDAFLAAAMVSAWLMAFLTDWGANRLRLAFEPVLPAGMLFVFSSILGSGAHQQSATLVFLCAVVLWALAQRFTGLSQHVVWLAADRRRGLASVTQAGLAVAAVAVVAGLTVGPRLPGAGNDELLDWRSTVDSPRKVVSPFVDLESRLVSNDSTVLFHVTADAPAYWRLAGLDTYDDEKKTWTLTDQFVASEGRLPGELPRDGSTEVIRQEFTIENLQAIWLPAAYAPAFLEADGIDATWSSDTASLTVSSDYEDADGATYIVESVVPRYTAAELAAAPATIPSDVAERYLGLPEDLTPVLGAQADAVTAGMTNRYDQMMALQNWFRTFEYSLRLGPRGDDPIETFLSEQVGFCQQFSGTFALMARHLGAPARVAVGFTWGDPVEGEDGTWQVTSRHTHAWPEVWFDGLGWVAFEPTPNRGVPDAPYTNLAAQQDSDLQPVDPAAASTTTTTDPTSGSSTTLLEPDFPDFAGDPNALPQSDTSGGGVPWPLVVGVAAIAVYAVVVPALQRSRVRRRRESAVSPDERIEVAWAEAVEALDTGFGIRRRSAETRQEFARRISSDLRLPEGVLGELAALTTLARYRAPIAVGAGSSEPSTGEGASRSDIAAARAVELGELVTQRVHDRLGRGQRARRALDPRSLFRR